MATSREIHLAARPHGVPQPTDFALVEVDVPEPADGEVLIRTQRFANPESGFAVLDGDLEGQLVVLVGTLAHLEERERVRVRGIWRQDRRYGPQVQVASAEPAR